MFISSSILELWRATDFPMFFDVSCFFVIFGVSLSACTVKSWFFRRQNGSGAVSSDVSRGQSGSGAVNTDVSEGTREEAPVR